MMMFLFYNDVVSLFIICIVLSSRWSGDEIVTLGTVVQMLNRACCSLLFKILYPFHDKGLRKETSTVLSTVPLAVAVARYGPSC